MEEEVGSNFKKKFYRISPSTFKQKFREEALETRLNEKNFERKAGTVIVALSFPEGCVLVADRMETEEGRNVKDTCTKLGNINESIVYGETGAVMPLELMSSAANEMSRYMTSIRQFDLGLENPEVSPKLEEISDFVSYCVTCLPGYTEFILLGEEKLGDIGLNLVLADGTIDNFETEYERQNPRDIKNRPSKLVTRGSGKHSAGNTLNVFGYRFTEKERKSNFYKTILQGDIDKNIAESIGLVAALLSSRDAPGAATSVGGDFNSIVLKKGEGLSLDVTLTTYSKEKIAELHDLALKVGGLDKEQKSIRLEEKLNESIGEHKGQKLRYKITDTLLGVGGYNKTKLRISQLKKPDSLVINQINNEDMGQIKKISQLIKETEIKSAESKEFYPDTGITTVISHLDSVLKRYNNFIIAYKADCALDSDEKDFFGKDKLPGVVIMRYLSPDEKNWAEHIGVLELEDNKKIGWSGVATHGRAGTSRRLEKLLFESVVYAANEIEKNIGLNSLLSCAFEFPIKEIFKLDHAAVDGRFAVEGFSGIGVEVGEGAEPKIIKLTPLGPYNTGNVQVVGYSGSRNAVKKMLSSLPEEAYEPETCYYAGLLALFKSISKEVKEYSTKKTGIPKLLIKLEELEKSKKKDPKLINDIANIVDNISNRLEIVHLTYGKTSPRMKLSKEKVKYMINKIIDEKLYS